MPIESWAAELGVTKSTLYNRLHRGWTIERTLGSSKLSPNGRPVDDPMQWCSKCGQDLPRDYFSRSGMPCRQCRNRIRRMGPRPRDKKKKIGSSCVVCGFLYVDIHHRNGKKAGNVPENLIPLCPNHHRMVHRGLLSLL
jgi:hypothetical protein